MIGPWQPASNGAGKRHWFLYRDAPDAADRYYWASGRLVRYASYVTSKRAADRLNARP